MTNLNGLPIHYPAWPLTISPNNLSLPDTPITEYWLVFTTSSQWISRYLKPNFGHVYILTRDEFNWLVLNPERLYLRAEIAPMPADHDLINKWCKDHETVIKLEFMPRNSTNRFGWGGFFSCVTLVRYVLGLRLSCLTPFGLYKKLLRLTESDKRALRLADVILIKQGSSTCQKSAAQ